MSKNDMNKNYKTSGLQTPHISNNSRDQKAQKSRFRVIFYGLLFLFEAALFWFLAGCAPVKFSNMGDHEFKKEPTYFEHYMNYEYDRDTMIAWLFSEAGQCRGKIYDIKIEIEGMKPLTQAQEDRIFVLEERINQLIDRFNDRSFFKRSTEYLNLFWHSEGFVTSYSIDGIAQNGMPVSSLSDSRTGVLNSIFKNGLLMESVTLLNKDKKSFFK